ncbi:MAG: radical SAM protein [Proteobacteria bacterium]|nr:radical SAM protein [Pseudomonadota bacterium]
MHTPLPMTQQAWKIRLAFGPEIGFFAPGAKHYDNQYYSNRPFSFAHLSVTGEACACRCAHCEGALLKTMIGAISPQAMRRVVDDLLKKGCRGILVSGGSDANGEVHLQPFAEVMGYAKRMGLKVLAHGGLIQRETAARLKEAGVDQVLMDVIGDEGTIREVCHLNRKPGDYLQSMLYCRDAGLNIAPHIVIGLHFGQIRGEERALEMIRQADPETIVLVILTPARGTAMAGIQPPAMDEVARIMATARILNPATPITLGCTRPPGKYKRRAERIAIDCGVNGIAYPDETTVDYARSQGLKTVFSEECCSLLPFPVLIACR